MPQIAIRVDDEFYRLVLEKSEYKKIDFSKQEDVEEFFGEEDFSEYEELINDDIEYIEKFQLKSP